MSFFKSFLKTAGRVAVETAKYSMKEINNALTPYEPGVPKKISAL